MASVGKPKGPAQQQLDLLYSVFGPQYFKHGRLLVTVARDISGVMKVAHKLQTKVNDSFSPIVEVVMEHTKYEWWLKLHETTVTVGLRKGEEVPECQVTHIPEGVRVHPYRRERMPSLEVLFLWEDQAGATHGHCVFTMAHPDVPSVEQVDQIFSRIESYFAMRWVVVQLTLAPPVRGEFEELDPGGSDEPPVESDGHAGAGVAVAVLACHPYGFASELDAEAAAHVRECQPLQFQGTTDGTGSAKICFLPAAVNKIKVAETSRFHGTEVMLPLSEVLPFKEGFTTIKVQLTPKAVASVMVHVFVMPRILPQADETDGIVDWASEERDALPEAAVEVSTLKDGEAPVSLRHVGGDCFTAEDGGLPEGFVNIVAHCSGYEGEERAVMLLVGVNEFYLPLRKRH